MFPTFPDPTFRDPTAPPPDVPRPRAAVSRPEAVLAELASGNQRFVAGQPRHGHRIASAVAVADQLRPYAAVVGCMDARVPVEAVFDQDFGALCVIRTAGHVLDRAGLGSVEIAVDTLMVRLVMVLGHTRCAAVAAAVAGRRPGGNADQVMDEIGRAITAADRDRSDRARVVIRRHVVNTAERLRATLHAAPVHVVGAVYDVETGRVDVLDPHRTRAAV